MCCTIRVLYACTYVPTLAEKGCPSYNARKSLVWDNQSSTHVSPPIVEYCPKAKGLQGAGEPGRCVTRESINAEDELV